jgi:hypothetical protein
MSIERQMIGEPYLIQPMKEKSMMKEYLKRNRKDIEASPVYSTTW